MSRFLRSRVPRRRALWAGLTFLAGVLGGPAASSFHESTHMLSQPLYWVVLAASCLCCVVSIEFVTGKGKWICWAVAGSGMVMLTVAALVLAFPSLEGIPRRALVSTLLSALLLGGVIASVSFRRFRSKSAP